MESRVFAFDFIRVVAILLVLMTHAATLFPLSLENLSVFLPLYHVGQLSNGLFFMLSGALMLPRERRRGFPFLWRRVGKFFLLLVLWSIATNACAYFAEGSGVAAAVCRAVQENSVVVGGRLGAAGQLWFLSVIAALYLGLPFVGRMTQGMGGREYVLFSLLTCVLVLLPSTFDGARSARTLLDPESEVLFGSYPLFGTFLAWFLLGDGFARFDVAGRLRAHVRLAAFLLFLGLCLSIAAASLWEVSLMRAAGRAEMYLPVHLYHQSLFLFAEGAVCFLLLELLARHLVCLRRGAAALSADVFGVFLSHMAVRCFVPGLLSAAGVTMAQPLLFGSGAFAFMLVLSWLCARGLRRFAWLAWLVR